jgi:hypothetical protein
MNADSSAISVSTRVTEATKILLASIESGGEGAAEYLHRLARSIRDGHTWLCSSWTLDKFGIDGHGDNGA